ncbi:MAG: protein tyrosine phosphatase family protein [Anaerolineae bacterium]|nr:protein tyrosine phosphatase family protein [Anaerolineae bacterium]
MQSITNFRRLAPDLITGGQPTEAQLASVAAAGFEAVINLGRLDPAYALPDERGTVAALGMVYEHIPVVWEQPTPADLDAFNAAMERYAGRRVFVHCAANYRASAFILLYRVLRLGWRLEDALPDMRAIWDPAEYPAWQAFIEEMLHGTDFP